MNVKSELLNYCTLPANQWNYYEIPIGEDWYNKYGYFPVIDRIHYINDNDACNGIVLFDAISIESEGGVVYFDDVSVVKKNYVELEGGERVYYYHNDHLGTPQVMTDITGNVVWKGDYEPFGKVNIVVENIENNFRFPGQYYISETGLYYNWWRWYKSKIGRYSSKDPAERIDLSYIPSDLQNISKKGNWLKDIKDITNKPLMLVNLYQYSNSNPIIFIDPTGLWVCTIICTIGDVVCDFLLCDEQCISRCLLATYDPIICFPACIFICGFSCAGPAIICHQLCHKKEDCKK